MSSGGGRGHTGGTHAAGAGDEIAEPFRAVLEAERRSLTAVVRPEDLARWRTRVVREVMDRRSPYAQALRRGHPPCRQDEFFRTWRSLIADALQRVAPTGRAEGLAIATLAALQGGATLSRLADDAGSLEAALDIALALVVPPEEQRALRDRSPR